MFCGWSRFDWKFGFNGSRLELLIDYQIDLVAFGLNGNLRTSLCLQKYLQRTADPAKLDPADCLQRVSGGSVREYQVIALAVLPVLRAGHWAVGCYGYDCASRGRLCRDTGGPGRPVGILRVSNRVRDRGGHKQNSYRSERSRLTQPQTASLTQCTRCEFS